MRDKTGQFVKGHRPSPETEFKKGNISWSKLHPELMRRGKNHPMYGKHHSEKTRKKMSKSHEWQIGNRSPSWKGGKLIKGDYTLIYAPDHPHKTKGKYIYEHRLAMEKYLGRYLSSEEVVHHINGDKHDNRIKNLKLYANDSKHRKSHPLIKIGKKLITLTI